MISNNPDTPEIISEETIYTGRSVNLKKAKLRTAEGKILEREVVEHEASVGILPITEDGRFVFVRQFRAPARDRLLELPAGGIEPGETPEQAAARELCEEIGETPGSLRRVAGFFLAPGWATEYMHVFIASGLTPQTAQADDDEDIEKELLTPREALAAISSGEIADCKSVALIGIYFAEMYMNRANRADPWLNDNPDEF
ncbi:MAG TPA: NUDIX hydrolase [Armatimonadota bacterium]|nr:NUDIX hydrolase [Armatimonadota bacterium]